MLPLYRDSRPYFKKYGKLSGLIITLLLLWKFKKLQEPVIVAGAAIVGLIAYPLLNP